ncbi:MAG TPA: hypothetical protein VGN89_09420 [Phenylobacterium sp.]|nr:hypothetical protein [Phenylobacterium sp.]
MSSAISVRRPEGRTAASVAALVLAAVLAGCAAPAPPPPPPPAPVAVVPPVNLSPRVVEQAAAYRAYVARASTISPNFSGGEDVAQSLKSAESYEPGQLLRGAIAYGAVVALQDPAFVAGVRKFVGDPDQRRTVAYEVMKDPAYAVGFSGSASAAGLVMNALGGDGRKLLDTGRSVKQAAYDVQHQPWSKIEVPGRDGRLALAKQLSATSAPGEIAETARLQLAVTGGAQMGFSAESASPPYTPLVIRSLAVAALAALGYADDASLAQVMPILAETNSASCLNMSKLNLYQCLAVSKPHYEDVFCLGQHILMDTGHCLMKGAGVTDPIDVKLAEAAAAKAAAVPAPPPQKARPRSKKR